MEEISKAVVSRLEPVDDQPPQFRRVWTVSSAEQHFQTLPTRITIDNSTLNDYTIIDIFTHDRTGLIYHILRTLHELDLDICYAKIGTHVDQVVDVFYVTDKNGMQVNDEARIQHVRSTLLEAIENA